MRQRLLDLVTKRKALLDKAIESDELYPRRPAELESAQQRLLDVIERFDAFLDEHLLWGRITAAAWPLVVAVTGWQLKASQEASDFSNAVGEALLAVAAGFYIQACSQDTSVDPRTGSSGVCTDSGSRHSSSPRWRWERCP